jgi:hypothetical protein
VIEKQTHLLGEDHEDTLSSMNNLAEMLLEKKDIEAGMALFQKVVELRKRKYPEDDPETQELLCRIGDWHTRLGSFAEAEPIYEEVYDTRIDQLGPGHVDTVCVTNRLVYVLQQLNKINEGVERIIPVVAAAPQKLPKKHGERIVLHAQMSRLLIALKKYDEAEKEADAYYEGACLKNDPKYILDALNTLIYLYKKWGKPEKAENYRLLLESSKQGQ